MIPVYATVTGHDRQKERLSRPMVAPSVILTGPRGVGKRRIANCLAATLACYSGNPRRGCGCKSCTGGLRHGVHVYGNKLLVAEARELVKKATQPPYNTTNQVFILDGCGMTPSASNALLKILEEPPDTSKFILVHHSDQPSLLPTIRSRSWVEGFYPLKPGEIGEVLRIRNISVNSKYRSFMLATGSVSGVAEGEEAFNEFLRLSIKIMREIGEIKYNEIQELAQVASSACGRTGLVDFLRVFEFVLCSAVKDHTFEGRTSELPVAFSTASYGAMGRTLSWMYKASVKKPNLRNFMVGFLVALRMDSLGVAWQG